MPCIIFVSLYRENNELKMYILTPALASGQLLFTYLVRAARLMVAFDIMDLYTRVVLLDHAIYGGFCMVFEYL